MGVSWADLFERRRDIERRFGTIFDLPVVALGDAPSPASIGGGQ